MLQPGDTVSTLFPLKKFDPQKLEAILKKNARVIHGLDLTKIHEYSQQAAQLPQQEQARLSAPVTAAPQGVVPRSGDEHLVFPYPRAADDSTPEQDIDLMVKVLKSHFATFHPSLGPTVKFITSDHPKAPVQGAHVEEAAKRAGLHVHGTPRAIPAPRRIENTSGTSLFRSSSSLKSLEYTIGHAPVADPQSTAEEGSPVPVGHRPGPEDID